MISIQQAGIEILGNNPGHLYYFCGEEYGVKQKYIEHLTTIYDEVVDVDSLGDLFRSFKRKSLVSSKNSLYVCRYDSDFVRNLSSSTVEDINVGSINGCVVAVYDDEKSFKKLDKFFSSYVVRFDSVSKQFVFKYVKSDFPELDDRYVSLVVNNCEGGYGQAKIVCSQLNAVRHKLHSLEDTEILSTFGIHNSLTEDQMMRYAACRNVSGVVKVVDSYEGDMNHLINGMCHVAIELDKAMDSRKETPYSKYVKHWTREDVYNFFEQAYTLTLQLRSEVGGNPYEALIYLTSLLKFKHIPSVENMICSF